MVSDTEDIKLGVTRQWSAPLITKIELEADVIFNCNYFVKVKQCEKWMLKIYL